MSHAINAAENAQPLRRFTVFRTGTAIDIDGRLAEPVWEHATLIDIPFESFPGENVRPPVETHCLVTYDDAHLYVGFRAYDPEPQKIRAHLMDRDQMETLAQDDYVGFMLDTFDGQRQAYQFRVNPLGVQADAFTPQSGWVWQWDMIWESAGRITDYGYSVEVALPLHQLRFPGSGEELTFGFAALRSWPRKVRHRMLSYFWNKRDSCWKCQFNKISGFSDLSPGRDLEVDPTLTSSRTDRREDFPTGGLESGPIDVEAGLSASWGITPSLTLSGTINPDFSQVEADVAQLEVNERFALFFPEKRPFFLEGFGRFETPQRAVYTRTVADPVWGAKLTGRKGANALGVFVTRDRINNLVIPSNQVSTFESVDQDVTGAAMSFSRDVGRSSSFGVLYTRREASQYHNRVVGFDGRVALRGSHTLEFQYLSSNTLYPTDVALGHEQESDPFGGRSLLIEYDYSTRDWFWKASYEDLSPGFRADFGFIPRVDVRKLEGRISRTWWGDEKSWWTNFLLQPRFTRIIDHQGTLTNQNLELDFRLQGPMQSIWGVNVSANKEYFNNDTFDLNKLAFHFEIQPAASFRLNLDGNIGNEIDSFNTQQGILFRLRPDAGLKLGRRVNLNLNHSYQRLDVKEATLFVERLTEARFFYHFDLRTLARLTLRYRSIERDQTLFATPVDPEASGLFVQLLLSYKLNPRTVVFLGYSDNHLGGHGMQLTRADRTLFFKLGYAWTL